MLKSGMSETPFPRLSGWIWDKKGGSRSAIALLCIGHSLWLRCQSWKPYIFPSQEWPISNFPYTPHQKFNSITFTHFISLVRWKMIILPILTNTSPIHFSLKGWENVLLELGSESLRVTNSLAVFSSQNWLVTLIAFRWHRSSLPLMRRMLTLRIRARTHSPWKSQTLRNTKVCTNMVRRGQNIVLNRVTDHLFLASIWKMSTHRLYIWNPIPDQKQKKAGFFCLFLVWDSIKNPVSQIYDPCFMLTHPDTL